MAPVGAPPGRRGDLAAKRIPPRASGLTCDGCHIQMIMNTPLLPEYPHQFTLLGETMNFRSDNACRSVLPAFLLVVVASSLGCGSSVKSVTIDPPKPVIKPNITLSVSPAAVSTGQTATLSWDVPDATSCEAVDAWSGTKPTSGSLNVSLSSPTAQNYTLQCKSDTGGIAQKTVTLAASQTAGQCSTTAARANSKRGGGRRRISGKHS